MGDFEDVFGAGADAVDIIDAICAEEAAFERKARADEEIIEHRFWFPDYETAERWAEYHRGTAFRRVKRQSGYEVTVKDRRDAASRLKKRPTRKCDRTDMEADTIKPLYLTELADHEAIHGDFRVRLAKAGSPLLAAFLSKLRDTLPFGREHVSPMLLPMKELRVMCKQVTAHLCHDFDIGQGMIGIFSADHQLLIGRRVGKDVEIWPWILEMDCGGGEVTEGPEVDCFLCNRFLAEGISPHATYRRNDLYGDVPGEHVSYVARKHYLGGVRPPTLATCILEWVGLLSAHDSKLSETLQPPSALRLSKGDVSGFKSSIDHWCKVLAWATVATEDFDKDFSVSFDFKRCLDTVFQTGPGQMAFRLNRLQFDKLVDTGDEPENVPDVAGVSLNACLPEWETVIRARLEWQESGIVWPDRSPIGFHAVFPRAFSEHEKLRIVKFRMELSKLNLPTPVRAFLDCDLREVATLAIE